MTTATITPAMLRALRYLDVNLHHLRRPGICFRPGENGVPGDLTRSLHALVRLGLLEYGPGHSIKMTARAWREYEEAKDDPSVCLECFRPVAECVEHPNAF